MKDKDQDDIIDYETLLEEEPEADDLTDTEDEAEGTPDELNFHTDETYRGDPEWDPSQR